jgi:hypothetical protein
MCLCEGDEDENIRNLIPKVDSRQSSEVRNQQNWSASEESDAVPEGVGAAGT